MNNYRPTPNLSIGDLVQHAEIPNRTWKIEGFAYEYTCFKGKVEEITYYNLICVKTKETTFVLETCLVLVCRALYAEGYLRLLDKDGLPPVASVSSLLGEEVTPMKQPYKTTLRMTQEEKNELVDELLDQLIDTLNFIKVDGEASETLQSQLDTISSKLSETRNIEIIKKA